MATIVRGKNPRKPYTVRYWVDGRQRERSFVTSREARDFKIKVEHDVRAHIFVDPDVKTTLSEFAETWLAQHAVSDGSRRTYRSVFANRIEPVLGDIPLGKITRDQVRTLLLETMPADVGPDTIRTARTLLAAMLGEAAVSGKVRVNVAARIRLPDATSERAEFALATSAELQTLTEKLPEAWRLAVWLMRGCGLRIGEALAVRADSVRGHMLRAERQVLTTGRLGPLKGRKPGQYRDIPLPGYVGARVAEHVQLFGIPKDGYLFPMFASGQVLTDVFRKAFVRGANAAGLPKGFTPHDLRHTYASVALSAGIPITDVSRWLGHKSIQLTHSIYGHMVPSAVSRATAVLDQEYVNWSAPAKVPGERTLAA